MRTSRKTKTDIVFASVRYELKELRDICFACFNGPNPWVSSVESTTSYTCKLQATFVRNFFDSGYYGLGRIMLCRTLSRRCRGFLENIHALGEHLTFEMMRYRLFCGVNFDRKERYPLFCSTRYPTKKPRNAKLTYGTFWLGVQLKRAPSDVCESPQGTILLSQFLWKYA